MRDDLQKAISRTWMNRFASFGLIRFIESELFVKNIEQVLYATKAKIYSTGFIQQNQMYSYSSNSNIPGILLVTNQRILHFSKGNRLEQMSLDNVSIEIKKHLFWSYIHLQSSGYFYMNIGEINKKEMKNIAIFIHHLITNYPKPNQDKQKTKPRKKNY